MKKLFFLIALLSIACIAQADMLLFGVGAPAASGGGATPTFVQACGINNDGNSDTSVSCNLATTTTGQFAYAYLSVGGTNLPTTVTVGSNTLTFINSTYDSTNNNTVASYYKENITGGTTPAGTATWATADSFQRFTVLIYSGVAPASSLDGNNGNVQTAPGTGANAVTSGSITTTANGDLIIVCTTDEHNSAPSANVITAGTGFTVRSAGDADSTIQRCGDQVQSSFGSITGTFTITNDGVMATRIAAFKHN